MKILISTIMEEFNLSLQEMVNLYYILLAVIAVGSIIIESIIIKVFKNHKLGSFFLLISSLISLYFLIKWFHVASTQAFIGTIPWLFNIVLPIVIYPAFLFIAWVVTKRIK